jgi:hypothetical protein
VRGEGHDDHRRACGNYIQPWSRAVRAASVRLRADSFAMAEEM